MQRRKMVHFVLVLLNNSFQEEDAWESMVSKPYTERLQEARGSFKKHSTDTASNEELDGFKPYVEALGSLEKQFTAKAGKEELEGYVNFQEYVSKHQFTLFSCPISKVWRQSTWLAVIQVREDDDKTFYFDHTNLTEALKGVGKMYLPHYENNLDTYLTEQQIQDEIEHFQEKFHTDLNEAKAFIQDSNPCANLFVMNIAGPSLPVGTV